MLYFFAIGPADQLPIWFKAFFSLAAIIGLGMAVVSLAKVFRVMVTPGDWKVSVNDDHLLWETAIPHQDFPMQIPLTDIEQAVRLETWRTGSDDSRYVDTRFELHLRDGSVRTVSQETAGINPHRVFLALRDRGVPYQLLKRDKTRDRSSSAPVIVEVY